jgi:hypothetical protein
MKLKEVVKKLNLRVLVGEDLLDNTVMGGYASDMLSDVLAHAKHERPFRDHHSQRENA